jgi:HEAT repeat protein
MTTIAESVRAVLVPFLAISAVLLLALTCYVVVLHGVRAYVARVRQRLVTFYHPLVDEALQGDDPAESLERLRAVPRRHLPVIATLLLEPLRFTEGAFTTRARTAATVIGLVAEWQTELGNRRWWRRAEAAHALGLIQCGTAVHSLIAALDDPYEEVRAAAVEALGFIADPIAIPALIVRLRDQSRHQRVRLVQALQQCGSAVESHLLEHGRANDEDLESVADLLGNIEAAGALEQLLEWCRHDRATVRVAAVRAIGTIGADERAYYHLLRGLNDDVADVRAAAAWALGRSGRQEAARYLAPRLHDEWLVAAQSARALRELGAAGLRELEAAAADNRGELARQMLWECGARSRA